MSEPASNVRFFCGSHAPEVVAKWAKKPLKWFFDPKFQKFVKKAFQVIGPQGPTVEHMFVKLSRIEKGKLVGTIANDPLLQTELRCGDTVFVKRSEIEDVFWEKTDGRS